MKYLMENDTNYWLPFVKLFLEKYRHAIHSSTNKAPFELMFNCVNNEYYALDGIRIGNLISKSALQVDKAASNMTLQKKALEWLHKIATRMVTYWNWRENISFASIIKFFS
jgi:hypothetical protein